MASVEEFQAAAERVQKLPKRPDNDTLLELYALYKQASEGDNAGKRPGLLDVKGRAKFDAWSAKKGTSAETARAQYVALVQRLEKR